MQVTTRNKKATQEHIITAGSAQGATVYLSEETTRLDVIAVSIDRRNAMLMDDEWAASNAVKILRSIFPVFDWQAVPVEG